MNLISILDAILKNGFISRDELITIGFSDNEIEKFISSGFLEQAAINEYVLGSVDKLFKFAIKNWKSNKEFANKLIDICYLKDRYNVVVNLWFLNNSIDDGKLEVFREHLENLEKVYAGDEYYSKDINYFYLLMTKAFDGIDSETLDRVKNLTLDDISVSMDDQRYMQHSFENEIRRSVYENYTIEADIKTDRKMDALSKVTIYDSIYAKLIKMANTKYKKLGRKMAREIENDNFESVQNSLKKLQESGRASKNDIYTLKTINAYLEISETCRIPIHKTVANANTYDHIDNLDFRRALTSYRGYNSNNILYLMLKKINELINSIVELRREKKNECTTLDRAISGVYIGDYQAIKEYLCEIDMADYYYLVRDALMISTLDNDQTFSKVIELLTDLSEGVFQFDSTKYIDLYKEALYAGEFPKAKLYYDILDYSQTFIFNPELEPELTSLYERFGGQKFATMVVDEDYGVLSLKNYVRLKMKELANGRSVIVLPPLGYKKTSEIFEMVSHFEDAVAFTIDDGDDKRIAIKKKKYTEEYIDLAPLVEEFQHYYVFQDYRKALEYGRELLSFGRPSAGVYAKCGLILYNLGEYNEAIDCLLIANSMVKRRGWDTNYDGLLEQCKKRRRQSFQSKFGGSFKELFRSEADLINSLIELSRDGGLSLEETVEKLGLTMEKINYAKLVYARDCYSDGDLECGDRYLREVIKSRNKTDLLKLLIKNLKANRLFYSHRKNQHMNCLVIKR